MTAPLLSVRDLRTYFHTFSGVVKAVNGVSQLSDDARFWAKASMFVLLGATTPQPKTPTRVAADIELWMLARAFWRSGADHAIPRWW